jgi:hypothetical protein
VATEPFLPLARAIARQEGFEHLPVVTVPHPIGGVEPGELDDAVLAVVDDLLQALTTAPAGEAAAASDQADEAPSDPVDFLTFAAERGWSDGLPMIVPTPERVGAAIEASGVAPGTSLGVVPPSNRTATIEAVAANAVMAGCLPEVMPVVVGAVRAMLAPEFNLQALATTTHPVTPLVMVHGPVVERLGFNGAANVFGQGNRANGTVGRAIRLVIQNIGEAIPGETDRATHGSPTKYTYCMAENAAESPFPTFHERRSGGPAGAVTVFGGEGPHNVNDHGSTDAPGLLRTIAGTMATLGCNNLYTRGPMLVVLSPEHAEVMAREGYDADRVASALAEMALADVSGVSDGNMERYVRISPHVFSELPADGKVTVVDGPEDILVLVAGGPGKHSVVVPSFGETVPTTVDVEA